jgi:hypothetical protein
MSDNLGTLSFDEVHKNLRLTQNDLKKASEPKPIETIISPLQKICVSLGSNKPYKPLFVPEEYKQQWSDYLTKRTKLQPRAMRYLCWEPTVASDKRFLEYLHRDNVSLSARSLQGIVRACHFNWNSVIQASFPKKDSSLEIVRGMVAKYKKPNKIIQKWNTSLDAVLSPQGPHSFAATMILESKPIKEYVELWGIDVQSEFFTNSMVQAVDQCRNSSVERYDYLFKKLLPWQLWGNTVFKKMIGDFILDEHFNKGEQGEKLQNFVLSEDRLGDPRLHRNNHKWSDMDKDARSRFIQWLSRADIVFFFEHVLPAGTDPHGRKEFWLNYFKQFKASRPMLCTTDENRLRISSSVMKDQIRTANFGKIRTDNSVFLLDFGTIVAVEFSVVGASYIYKYEDFKHFMSDFWSKQSYNESHFKRQDKCIGRIRHDRYGKWKNEMRNILSRYGVRPY